MVSSLAKATEVAIIFDNDIRDRIKYMDSFFHQYMDTLPSTVEVRMSATLAKLGMCVRKWQTSSGYSKKKEALIFEE